MSSKLLKYDLRKNMRWMWILFVCTIFVAGITRICTELAQSVAFFKIIGIFFDTIFYSLIANTIIQPFLRSFMNFTKSLYGDESYLTHTLPVTKNQIINSKYLTTIIEILLSFVCVIVSLIIKFASPSFLPTIKLILSTIISGEFSTILVIVLFILLVIVEFLIFISIIYFSIVLAYKTKEKKVLKSFLITGLLSFLSLTVLSIIMLVVLLINGVNLSSTTIVLSNSTFISIILTGIIVYFAFALLYYLLTKKEFNKGVNVD